MNLYQTLNQEYREFRMKKSLKESDLPESLKDNTSLAQDSIYKGFKSQEDKIPESDIETPSEEDFKQDDKAKLSARLDEISNRLTEIDEALENASEDEKESLQAEKQELSIEIDKIDKELNECSSTVKEGDCKDVKEDEIPEEIASEVDPEEVSEETKDSIISKIEAVASIPKEDLANELESLSDEEKESVKANLNSIKEIACELFPEECNAEAGDNLDTPVDDDDLPDSDEPEEKEEIKECEITNFKVVRHAPKHSAFMIEAQTSEGIKFITGKNFNSESKVLDEAEITESKQEATNRFKSLLETK